MKLSEYQESQKLQKDGAPIPVGDAIFYIRRQGTKESKELIRRLQMELFGPFHALQDEDDILLRAHWLVEYGCASWQGVFNEDDTPLEYSQQSARKVFLNPEYYLSLNAILWMAAHHFENYLHEEASEDLEAIKKK